MRSKLIVVYASLVLLMGILSFGFVRQAIQSSNRNPQVLAERARHEVAYVSSRLELAALAQERWLTTSPAVANAAEVMGRGTPEARGEAATAFCDGLISAAAAALGARPALMVLVDPSGKIVGRNGSTLSRGDDVATAHPAIKAALATGLSGSDVWYQPEKGEQFLVSYAPAFGKDHAVVGALVLGVTLADSLGTASSGSDGRTIGLAFQTQKGVEIAALRGDGDDAVRVNLTKAAAATLTSRAPVLDSSAVAQIAASGVGRLGDGKSVAVVVAAPEQLADSLNSLPWSLVGLFALLLVMTVAAGFMLGGYIQKPIEEIEEGLLSVLNGQTEKRFQLEHAELGGLSFRIDQLLNQLMGVEEDTSDDEGVVSNSSVKPPVAFDDVGDHPEAHGADEASLAKRLGAEPEDAYYTRVYREYVDAKNTIGEDASHISLDTFRQRIQGMEAEAQTKHGRPVRYQVKRNGNEIVLLAIPIG